MEAAQRHADTGSPFHEGERRIQSVLGVREEIEPWARRVVRPFLLGEHIEFYRQLPFLVAAARDARDRPWATVLAGSPGFISIPDDRRLDIDTSPRSGDALSGELKPGADVGLLGIELHTRRRNRVNGFVLLSTPSTLSVEVDQSFGNCPQHIRVRRWRTATPETTSVTPRRSDSLSKDHRDWITSADTFFIASGHPGDGPSRRSEGRSVGMDASHRGGPPGFVEVVSERELVFPDYAGNNHFNTLGNLLLDPRAGLLFVDFEKGSLLQLTGETRVDWNPPDPVRYPGAQRLVHFTIREVVEQRGVLPLRWSANEEDEQVLHLVDRVEDSLDAVSFYFEREDGRAVSAWKPGQHLPIELEPGHATARVRRTYSLSNAPGSPRYRITVKREERGLVSRYLHDAFTVGASLRAEAPSGAFSLDLEATPTTRPILLVGAGIGITPLASMLHAIRNERPEQPVTLVHGVRDARHHPLADELHGTLSAMPNAKHHIRYSRPGEGDLEAGRCHSTGRVDLALLDSITRLDECEIFLCGPAGFMAQLEGDLLERGIDPGAIHFESF